MFDELVGRGVKIVAPPMQRLVEQDPSAELLMKPSTYATEAKSRGLNIITWTLERTGPGLEGFYWSTLENIEVCSTEGTEEDSSSISKQIEACEIGLREGDKFNLLHVLAFQVEILGIFSDWPATVTFFANCYGLGIDETAMEEEEDPGTSAADNNNNKSNAGRCCCTSSWSHRTFPHGVK